MTNTPTLGPLGPENVTFQLDDIGCMNIHIQDGSNNALADLGKPDQARLFLYLAKNLGIDTDMLHDAALHVWMGGSLRGAGGEYDPSKSLANFGQPLMDVFYADDATEDSP